MNYYIYLNGQTIGPMTKEQIMNHPVNMNTQVSFHGGDWRPLSTYPELVRLFNAGRNGCPPPPPISNPSGVANSNRIVCGILALVIGSLGIQYFIIGKVGGGFINILLSLVTFGLWSIVNFVQGILILCMSDEEFERKFVNSKSVFPVF